MRSTWNGEKPGHPQVAANAFGRHRSNGVHDPDPVPNNSTPSSSTNEMIPLATTTLPRLDYSLRDRRVRIGIFWMLVFFDSVALPVLLYFILWYGTDLEHNIGTQSIKLHLALRTLLTSCL